MTRDIFPPGSDQPLPSCRPVSRREFVSLCGAAVGALASGAVGAKALPHAAAAVGPDDVLVRNPAFQAAVRDARLVLYCTNQRREFVAWELNRAAQRVWSQIPVHGDGDRVPLARIARELHPQLPAPQVTAFAEALLAHGLAYRETPAAQVYFEYEAPR